MANILAGLKAANQATRIGAIIRSGQSPMLAKLAEIGGVNASADFTALAAFWWNGGTRFLSAPMAIVMVENYCRQAKAINTDMEILIHVTGCLFAVWNQRDNHQQDIFRLPRAVSNRRREIALAKIRAFPIPYEAMEAAHAWLQLRIPEWQANRDIASPDRYPMILNDDVGEVRGVSIGWAAMHRARVHELPHGLFGAEWTNNTCIFRNGVEPSPEIPAPNMVAREGWQAVWTACTQTEIRAIYTLLYLSNSAKYDNMYLQASFLFTCALVKPGGCTESWIATRNDKLIAAVNMPGFRVQIEPEHIKRLRDIYFKEDIVTLRDVCSSIVIIRSQLVSNDLGTIRWILDQCRGLNVTAAVAMARSVATFSQLTYSTLVAAGFPVGQLRQFISLMAYIIRFPLHGALASPVTIGQYPDLAYLGTQLTLNTPRRRQFGGQAAPQYAGNVRNRVTMGVDVLDAYIQSIKDETRAGGEAQFGVLEVARQYNIRLINIPGRAGLYAIQDNAGVDGVDLPTNIAAVMARVALNPNDLAFQTIVNDFLNAVEQSDITTNYIDAAGRVVPPNVNFPDGLTGHLNTLGVPIASLNKGFGEWRFARGDGVPFHDTLDCITCAGAAAHVGRREEPAPQADADESDGGEDEVNEDDVDDVE